MKDIIEITINGDTYWFTKQELILSIIVIIFAIVCIILFFKRKKQNKKFSSSRSTDSNNQTISLKFNYNDYASFILYILSMGENTFFDDRQFQCNLYSQSLYYIYHIYICKQILSKKYNTYISELISDTAFNKISQVLSSGSNNIKFKNIMNINYTSLKRSDINIFSIQDEVHNGFTNLSKEFLNDLNLSTTDAISILNLTIKFTAFIKYHLKDILNPNIELVS